MDINTEYLRRTINTLELSYQRFQIAQASPNNQDDVDIYRHAVVKAFELGLEIVGKLLRRVLKSYSASPKEIDALFYKDLFRMAGKRGLLSPEDIDRWFNYRDNRNQTAHDYGEDFANLTIVLIPSFITDAKELMQKINNLNFNLA